MSFGLKLKPDLTIADVLKQIKLCISEDRGIDDELDKLLAERKHLESKIDDIMYPVEAHSLKQNTEALTKKITDTSVSAYSLSCKVRRLDEAQLRLEQAVARVDTIVNLKTTIDKVNDAIGRKQYEKAAEMTHSILHVDGVSIENDASFELLEELERKLVALVMKECDRAAVKAAESAKRRLQKSKTAPMSTRDQLMGVNTPQGGEKKQENKGSDGDISEEFRRVFGLCLVLPLLGKKYEGLGRYCFAARTMLVLGSRKLKVGDVNANKYPDKLSEMLDAIAFCIQRHTEPLRKRFGPGSELRIIQELVEECDTKIHLLLKKFMEAKKIAKIMKGVQKYRLQQADFKSEDTNTSKLESKYDPKMLDGLLEEVAYICREIQIFDFNLRQLGDKARSDLKEDKQQANLLAEMTKHRFSDGLPRTTKVNQLQQELTNHYIVLEEYFMTQDVQTAISLDEQTEGSQTTSMVDDVFYILKKCSERAFSTCCINSACAIVNLVNNMLATLYKKELQSKLAACWENSANLSQLLFAQDQQKKQSQAENNLASGLNNMQVSAGHILTLRKHLLAHSEEVFQHIPSAVKMATQCLEFLTETHDSFMRVVHTAINKFVGQQVDKVSGAMTLGCLLDRFGQQNYELKENEYSTRQVNDTFIPSLIEALTKQCKAVEGKLTDVNFDLVVHALVQHIVKRIENFALRKRFTFWGGLQFDKDVRKISTFFNSVCRKTVREKFTRLMQIASLLQVDKVEEIFDYWTSDTQVWRLSPREVKMVLCLRVEFSNAKVMQLKL